MANALASRLVTLSTTPDELARALSFFANSLKLERAARGTPWTTRDCSEHGRRLNALLNGWDTPSRRSGRDGNGHGRTRGVQPRDDGHYDDLGFEQSRGAKPIDTTPFEPEAS